MHRAIVIFVSFCQFGAAREGKQRISSAHIFVLLPSLLPLPEAPEAVVSGE